MKTTLLIFLTLIRISSISNSSMTEYMRILTEGDLIFQTSLSAQSKAIQLATHSEYSHCGILIKHNGGLEVLEAESVVQFTPIKEWIKRGKDEKAVSRYYSQGQENLSEESLLKLEKASFYFIGKPYDAYFDWSDDKIYCSELIWKIYKRALGVEIAIPQRLGDLDLTDDVVKSQLRKRYGENIPLNESVITPVQLFESNMFMTTPDK